VQVIDQADARKVQHGPEDALQLAKAAQKIIVAKGKKLVVLDMRVDAPDDQMLLSHLLGPTGHLRAPTVRRGKTLLVGFNDEAYQQMLAE
jgi:arsenate reductase-like glutaredoxin family protein